MIHFEAEDGYSYLIEVIMDGHHRKTYRIDSCPVSFELATNEELRIKRLDISPDISSKLGKIKINLP